MITKRFNGKAIYQPTGKAAEYSPWACNFYTGCSNDCEYCYCKRGVMSHVWSTEPRLKKCFKDEGVALNQFERELIINKIQLQRKGLLFSFTTDPLLPNTKDLTLIATEIAVRYGVPVKILTKRADFIDDVVSMNRESPIFENNKAAIAFGFTLTGFDDKEPGASTNQERIEAMRKLHDMGFKTFASIEPIIDPEISLDIVNATKDVCDLFKVGIMSGRKIGYNWVKMRRLMDRLVEMSRQGKKIYLKDSFLSHLGIKREECPGKFVNSDYNIFNQEKK